MLGWFKEYRELCSRVEKMQQDYADLRTSHYKNEDDKIRYWNRLNDRLIVLEPSRGIDGELGAMTRIAILEARLTSLEATC